MALVPDFDVRDGFFCNCTYCKRYIASKFEDAELINKSTFERARETSVLMRQKNLIKIGERVQVYGEFNGVVKWLGFLEPNSVAAKTYIGVKLDDNIYSSENGHHQNKFFFNCPTGHGVLVPYSAVVALPTPEKTPPITGNEMFPSYAQVRETRRLRALYQEELDELRNSRYARNRMRTASRESRTQYNDDRRSSCLDNRPQSAIDGRQQSVVDDRRQSVVDGRRPSTIDGRRQPAVDSLRQAVDCRRPSTIDDRRPSAVSNGWRLSTIDGRLPSTSQIALLQYSAQSSDSRSASAAGGKSRVTQGRYAAEMEKQRLAQVRKEFGGGDRAERLLATVKKLQTAYELGRQYVADESKTAVEEYPDDFC